MNTYNVDKGKPSCNEVILRESWLWLSNGIISIHIQCLQHSVAWTCQIIWGLLWESHHPLLCLDLVAVVWCRSWANLNDFAISRSDSYLSPFLDIAWIAFLQRIRSIQVAPPGGIHGHALSMFQEQEISTIRAALWRLFQKQARYRSTGKNSLSQCPRLWQYVTHVLSRTIHNEHYYYCHNDSQTNR